MSENRRATIVLRLLNKFYPRVSVPLKHRNLFTLLVSVALSAQTTDVNVNKATRKIYQKYDNNIRSSSMSKIDNELFRKMATTPPHYMGYIKKLLRSLHLQIFKMTCLRG